MIHDVDVKIVNMTFHPCVDLFGLYVLCLQYSVCIVVSVFTPHHGNHEMRLERRRCFGDMTKQPSVSCSKQRKVFWRLRHSKNETAFLSPTRTTISRSK